ncbi:hypothetical protein GCM10027290_61470 [Micromonospora sonneratiae]|uniref:Uncharacterized protein n=1 Tax=Micromonospora sonneratiae TaxID=1184706 RepID=A0ABW3YMV7_9ACTN
MANDPAPRPSRNGFAGGALLVLTMTIVLVVVLVVVIGSGSSTPPSTGAGATATADPFLPGPGDDLPLSSIPPDWTALTPGVTDVTAEPGVPPGDVVPAVPGRSTEPGQPVVPGRPVTATPRQTSTRQYSFTAVAGPGCAETAKSGAFAAFTAGSRAVTISGGWKGTGCSDGVFWSVPMSGEAGRDDAGTSVTWWFNTGTSAQGSCGVWLYIPRSDREADVAGKPTFYQVTRGRGDATVIDTFTIDQTATRGTWVKAGSFPLQRGQIGVKMLNRGAGTGGTRHAAAQVQVGCTT